ncbi:MAG TPA: efflux transporter outer membrane subunit [Candidatus Binatia bacterium]|jgi:NodT family efflux transporter outer membrane factor (OMF) lipoprotein
MIELTATTTGAKTNKLTTAALTAAFCLLVSCTVGPDYVRPKMEVPAAYKEVDGWRVAEPQDNALRGAWWEMFNEPELNALEDQVDISNQNIAGAEARYRQARALVQEARAAFYPTVTIGLGVNRAVKSGTVDSGFTSGGKGGGGGGSGGNSGGGGHPASFTTYTLPLDISWEIDVWGRIRRSVESARANAQASSGDLESARLSARSELAQDFFLLRALDTQKKLLDDAAAVFQTSLDLTNNRYKAGVASRGDVLQAETQLKSTQAQAIDVGVQRAQVEHAIALLIGKAPAELTIPPAVITAPPPAIPIGLPSEILQRRPDIAGAERRMASANAQIGVAIAAYYPTVSLASSGGFESGNFGQWFSSPSHFWSVGPSISETVFDGGLRAGQTAEARANYDATLAIYRETVLGAFQEVEDNLAALRILENEARVQDQAVAAARQTVVVTLNQYKAGIVNYINVTVVQAAALANERTAADILGRRMIAAVLLIKALGGGWSDSAIEASAS